MFHISSWKTLTKLDCADCVHLRLAWPHFTSIPLPLPLPPWLTTAPELWIKLFQDPWPQCTAEVCWAAGWWKACHHVLTAQRNHILRFCPGMALYQVLEHWFSNFIIICRVHRTQCWVPVLPLSPPPSFRFTPSGVGPANWNTYQVLGDADAAGWEPRLKNYSLRWSCSELLLLWDSVIWRLKGLRDPKPHPNPAWLGLQCSGRGWSRLEILK